METSSVFAGQTVRAVDHGAHGVNLAFEGNFIGPLPYIGSKLAIDTNHALAGAELAHVS
jgi:hypothetical protein